jgi:hypothetical protein
MNKTKYNLLDLRFSPVPGVYKYGDLAIHVEGVSNLRQ